MKEQDEKLLDMSVRSAKTHMASLDALSRLGNADLFEALALKVQEAATTSASIATFDAKFDSDLLTRGPMAEVGKRIFQRWSRTLHDFVCKPNSEDAGLRDKLIKSLTGKDGGMAVLAGILVATFGASPAVAALLAALFVRLFAQPAAEEICKAWDEQLAAGI